MDLNAYIGPLRKWWVLLVVASLVGAISSYLVTRQQPPVYQARTTLIIGRSVFIPNPTGSDFWLGQQLATFYADYAKREPVRNATMTALGLIWLPDYQVQPVPNSQLIEVVVTDTSPERAQAVANELANQLIKQSPASRESQTLEHQQFVQQQLINIEAEINKTTEEMAAKQKDLGELFSARQIADTEAELASLEAKLTTLQTNYAALLANSEQGASNTLSVIERASLPKRQIGPNTQMMVLLTTVVGLFLAVGAAYLIEYLDDTIKAPEEITRLLNLPVIGSISEVKKEETVVAFIAGQPRSAAADNYRSLRTNLEFAAVDKPLKTIYVSSAGVSEGKTYVAINLAVVMAQGGKRVILLDADLRRPSVYRSLGLSNNQGLSDIFRGHIDIHDAFAPWEAENIRVILSGNPPPNPADLLGSKKMDSILESLQQEADVVILDGPPFLVADASVLANKVDGVILVARHGLTRRESLKVALERLRHAGANVLGVVLNRVPRSTYRGYGNLGYDAYYSREDGKVGQEGRVSARRSRSGTAVPISTRFGVLFQAVSNGFPKLRGGRLRRTAGSLETSPDASGNGSKPSHSEEEGGGQEVEPLLVTREAVQTSEIIIDETPLPAIAPQEPVPAASPTAQAETLAAETSFAVEVFPEPGDSQGKSEQENLSVPDPAPPTVAIAKPRRSVRRAKKG